MQRPRRHGTPRRPRSADAPVSGPSAHRRLAVVGLVALAVGTVGITASSPLHGREAARPAASPPAGRPDQDGPDGGARAAILRALPGGVPRDSVTRSTVTHGDGLTGPSTGAAPRGATTEGSGPHGAAAGGAGRGGAARAGGATGLEPEATSAVLAAAGDLDLSNVTDPREALGRLRGYGTSADLGLCRLLAPLPSHPPTPGGPTSADARAAGAPANARTADARTVGARTVDALAAVGFDRCGASADAGAAATTVHGMVVTVLSYPDSSTLTGPQVDRDAERARGDGSDLVVVRVAWGRPGQTTVSARQRALAREVLTSPAVDLVLGAGTGNPLPIERVAGRYVAYDLGTLVGPDPLTHPGDPRNLDVPSNPTRSEGSRSLAGSEGSAGSADAGGGRAGLLLTAHVRRTALGWMVADLTYTPTWTDPAGTGCWPIADALDDRTAPTGIRHQLTAAWHRVIAAEGTLGSTDGVRVDRLPRDLAPPP
jgi:poly-gamma-glutamate synthesis protein (capsule biosynthesis protein)